MIGFFRDNNILAHESMAVCYENNSDQVIAFERAGYLFIFNFNPFKSHSDYAISAPSGSYHLVIDSDAKDFGGFGRIDSETLYLSHEKDEKLLVYLPTLTCLVLAKE